MQCEAGQSDFVDFIDKCLEWKPEKRMSPEDAFRHPWIKAGIKELKQKMEQAPQAPVETQAPPNSSGTVHQQVHGGGLPTINDSQQHSRTTGGSKGEQVSSQTSSNRLAQPVNSPKMSKKLIISEDQIIRNNEAANLANKNLSPRIVANRNSDGSQIKMKNPALPNIQWAFFSS